MYKNKNKMDLIFEAALTHDSSSSDLDDIPQTREPVWILGRKYDASRDVTAIRADIKSKFWFTYRKGFVPIGDSGLTSDRGWGCMLRCGQMVLAQALVCLHLGRDWRWRKESREPEYLKILKMFEDTKTATYSIHQIALMGVSEGKDVGQWFGPNTVTQVLKKLSVYDKWSSLVIHVALDNTIVINDIKNLCRRTDQSVIENTSRNCSSLNGPDVLNIVKKWKPLLLVVPLRLGLSEVNPVYISGLKTCFTFRQSLGVIGGKPNHALYFIGCVGEHVIYLDPHTTQPVSIVNAKEHSYEKTADLTYHCPRASRSRILDMDPSVAVCFFCSSEVEFDILCQQIQEKLVNSEKQPLFEITQNKPRHWSPVEDHAEEALDLGDYEHSFEHSDEDFVLLGHFSTQSTCTEMCDILLACREAKRRCEGHSTERNAEEENKQQENQRSQKRKKKKKKKKKKRKRKFFLSKFFSENN